MLSVLLLLSVFYVGYVLAKKISASFIVGSLFCITAIFILLFLSHSLISALIIYSIGFLIIFGFTFKTAMKKVQSENRMQVLLYIALFVLAFMLFEKSFSYDSLNQSFLIQSNLYQDFGGRISHIRYFSSEEAFIPEIPYFAGGRVLYHFMFEFYAGVLEYLGARVDIAFNLISAFSLTSLVFLLFEFGSRLFKSRLVGILAPIFFVFISDLSFINLFQKYGLSFKSFYNHNTYVLGSFMGTEMGRNFLYINTYLNQRHLVFGLSVFLFILYTIFFQKEKLSNKSLFLVVLLIGALPFWHLQILLAVYVLLAAAAFLFKDLRNQIIKVILFSLILVVPQLLLIRMNSLNQILFKPGFTISENLSLTGFANFWIWNLGFSIPLAIFGLIKSNSFQRKIFLCFLSLFIIANLFQFGRDMFDNHKFFNAFLISINTFSAYGIYHLFKQGILFKGVAVLGIILMTISGIFHMLVVKNDVYAKVPDGLQTEFGKWIRNNITSQNIILTNGEIYDPVTLAGRKIFLGRAHYVFLFGGDPSKRIGEKNVVLAGEDDKAITEILSRNKISYIIIYKEGVAPNLIQSNTDYFNKNFKKMYEDNISIIFKI